jgi:D-arabinose 1-dehydrogenase-like Zn-dependent alcohol dehydrogenase
MVCASTIQSYEFATSILAKHGTLVAVGQPPESIPFHWSTFVSKDITVVPGCLGDKETMEKMMECVVRDGIHVEVKEYSLDPELSGMGELLKSYHESDMVGKLVLRID